MRSALAIAVLLLASSISAETPTLRDVAFMEGRWIGLDGDTFTEETWGPPAGDSMPGMFRIVAKQKTVMYEFLTIEQTEQGPVLRFKHFAPGKGLVSREARDESLNLPLVRVGDQDATFEGKNAEGKLVRIRYSRHERNRLTAVLEREKNGAMKADTFEFTLSNPCFPPR